MKKGLLKVTVDYGSGYISEATHYAYSYLNNDVMVSHLVDGMSTDHSARTYYGVDVCANPGGVFGSTPNITFEWVEPVVYVLGE